MVTQAVAGMQVGSDTTVAERLDKWLDLVADELSPTTLRGYRGVVRGKIVPALGAVKIRKLRPSQIDALYLALVRDEGLAPATVRQVHAVLRRTLSQAVKWGWIQANPAVNASPPRSRRPDIRPPDLAEVRKLIAEADASAPDFATFLRLMVATGLRRGEACALRWSDLDVDAASLLVERAIITVTGKGTAEKDTKTHAARRIALDPGTLGVLLAHHAVVEERARVCGAHLDPDAFIFSHAPDDSRSWYPDNVSSAFISLRDRVGLEGVRLHDLGHMHATQLLAAGVRADGRQGRERAHHRGLRSRWRQDQGVAGVSRYEGSRGAARLTTRRRSRIPPTHAPPRNSRPGARRGAHWAVLHVREVLGS